MTSFFSRLGRTSALIVAAGLVAHAASDGNMAVSVVDASGKPVAGATVTITSPTQIGGARTAVTDATGKVRFVRLAPGDFKVQVTANGFQTQTMNNVAVAVDQTAAVNARLAPVGAATVEVVSNVAAVDVTTVTQGMQIDSKELEALPMARTQLSALTLAPGVVSVGGNPAIVSGLNRDNFGGNGARNNTYMIDGIDVTSPEAGTSRTNLAPELIQVQDVKTGAITAEYSARAGLFSNVTTKAGGNEYTGGLTLSKRPGSLTNKVGKGRFDVGEQDVSDYTAWAMGPIIKDKLWFVLSYQQVKDETTVRLSPTVSVTPGETRTGRNYDGYSVFGKLTWQITPNDIADITFNSNPYEFDNLSGPLVVTRRAALTEQGGTRFLAHYGHQWSNLFLDVRLAQHKEDNKTKALYHDAGPQNTVVASTTLSPLQRQLGNNAALDERTYQKDRLRVDLTWLFEAAGSHTLKAGVEKGTDKLTQFLGVDQGGNSYESFNVGTYAWATLPSSQANSQKARTLTAINGPDYTAVYAALVSAGFTPTGAANAYHGATFTNVNLASYVFNEANPFGGFYEYRFHQVNAQKSSPKMDIQGAYVQDSWQIGKFTFSPGFRVDKYSYVADNGTKLFETDYAFAPRVGLTYDVKGDGKSKLYAYWGRYIDPIKLDMVRFTGSLTSSERTEDIRILNTWVTVNRRGGTKTVDAVFANTFKLPKTEEFRLGYSTDFGGIYTFDVTYSQRRDYDIVEDWDPTLYTDADNLEDEARDHYGMGTTAYGSLTATQQRIIDAYRSLVINTEYFAGGGYTGAQNVARVAGGTLNFVLANLPGGERNYRTWEFTFNRREADHWGGFASLSLVNAEGNTFSSGNADYQGDLAMFDPRLAYTNGKLDGSVDWLLKANAFYKFDGQFDSSWLSWTKGLMVAATFNANSGYHYTNSMLVGTRVLQAVPSEANFFSQQLGTNKTPMFFQTDVRVQYGRNLTSRLRGEVFLDIFNIYNKQGATGIAEGLGVRSGIQPNAPYQFQLPRSFQLGVRLKF